MGEIANHDQASIGRIPKPVDNQGINQSLEHRLNVTKLRILPELKSHGIPVDEWGKGKAKTVDHLAKEIVEGEAILNTSKDGELVREVNVIGMDVFHKGEDGTIYRLVEDRQVFKDGREKRRELPVSMGEKIKPGEDLDIAAVRAVREELGVEGEIPVEHTKTVSSERVSNSYPGLKGQYNEYRYSSWLTNEQFKPEGYVENQADKDVHFVWREVNDILVDNAA